MKGGLQMAETVSFSKNKINQSVKMKKRGPVPATLKYALGDDLPASEDKNVLIYTLDKDELWHGNGYGYPLSKVNYGATVTKDLTFVGFDVNKGLLDPELLFPYFGSIKEVCLSIPSSKPLTSRLIIDLEVQRGDTWITVKRLYVESGKTRLNEIVDFKINDEALRLNAIDVQTGGLDSLVVVAKIDV
jgi:hypothetical protein